MTYTVALLLVAVSAVSSSVIGGVSLIGPSATLVGPASIGATLKGPSSAATVIGPDGSSISAAAEGGAVVAPSIAGGAVVSSVVPGAVVGHPVVGVQRYIGAPAIGGLGTVVAGPSGVIATNGLGQLVGPVGPVVGPVGSVVGPVGHLGYGGLGWGHGLVY